LQRIGDHGHDHGRAELGAGRNRDGIVGHEKIAVLYFRRLYGLMRCLSFRRLFAFQFET
jgi:hypothetical protein